MKSRENKIAPQLLKLCQQMEEAEATVALLWEQLSPICKVRRVPPITDNGPEPVTKFEAELRKLNLRLQRLIAQVDVLANAVDL